MGEEKKKTSETKSKYGIFKAHSHSELSFCVKNNNPPLIPLILDICFILLFLFILFRCCQLVVVAVTATAIKSLKLWTQKEKKNKNESIYKARPFVVSDVKFFFPLCIVLFKYWCMCAPMTFVFGGTLAVQSKAKCLARTVMWGKVLRVLWK